MVEAVVEFDYVAQEPDELSICKGDTITNIRTQPGGWWEGSLRGKRGMFPDNFVKLRLTDVLPAQKQHATMNLTDQLSEWKSCETELCIIARHVGKSVAHMRKNVMMC
uniref:SH3 domain-containing protein n=1 Tax=Timema shepardi TaxID=629360 RepID=A0A7R9B828_TIMSH|nr:unnamed protein product [Timema shepardi]